MMMMKMMDLCWALLLHRLRRPKTVVRMEGGPKMKDWRGKPTTCALDGIMGCKVGAGIIILGVNVFLHDFFPLDLFRMNA